MLPAAALGRCSAAPFVSLRKPAVRPTAARASKPTSVTVRDMEFLLPDRAGRSTALGPPISLDTSGAENVPSGVPESARPHPQPLSQGRGEKRSVSSSPSPLGEGLG